MTSERFRTDRSHGRLDGEDQSTEGPLVDETSGFLLLPDLLDGVVGSGRRGSQGPDDGDAGETSQWFPEKTDGTGQVTE